MLPPEIYFIEFLEGFARLNPPASIAGERGTLHSALPMKGATQAFLIERDFFRSRPVLIYEDYWTHVRHLAGWNRCGAP